MDYAKPTDVVANSLGLGHFDDLRGNAGRLDGAHVVQRHREQHAMRDAAVTLGNLVGGAVFTGLALYLTYKPNPVAKPVAGVAPIAAE